MTAPITPKPGFTPARSRVDRVIDVAHALILAAVFVGALCLGCVFTGRVMWVDPLAMIANVLFLLGALALLGYELLVKRDRL